MRSTITLAGPDDMSLVYSSWLHGYQESDQNIGIPSRVYFRAQTALIGELLKDAKVLVARSDVDPLVIRGYAVGAKGELHWLYVKSRWRKQGIGDELLRSELWDEPLTRFTHAREPGSRWLRSRGLTYDGRLFGGR